VETPVVVDGQEAAQFLREAQQFNGFRDRGRERLVDYDVAASSQALPRNRKVRLIRGGNYHQANRSDGQQFVDAADSLDIRKHSCHRITGALYDGRKPQSGHGADHWRMKASPGESEPNQPDVDHPHDPQRSASSVSPTSVLLAMVAFGRGLVLAAPAVYPFLVERTPPKQHGPARGLYLGLAITILALLAYGGYITMQFAGVRKLQSELVDRNRRDSLQLLRIQNDLNAIALAMRDMLDNTEPYPLTAWTAQFQRIRTDLENALKIEEDLAPTHRTPEQKQYLTSSLAQFWDAVDRTFALAQSGKPEEARSQIRLTLQARQSALSTAVARLLVENNESEEQANQQIRAIYDRVQR